MAEVVVPELGLVVRGGQLRSEALLRRAVRDRRDSDGQHRLSVWVGVAEADEDEEAVLARLVAEAPIVHGQLNVALIRDVHAAGFWLEHSPPPHCHYDLMLGTVMDEGVVERFVQVFGRLRRNRWRP